MAGKKLAAGVWVGGEFYPTGSTPSGEVAEQIDNPKAWGEEPDAEGDEKPKRATRSQKQK